jgi:hypothetical protein
VVKLLAQLRPELRPLYVDAWRERQTGRGKPVEVRVEGTPPFQASGLCAHSDDLDRLFRSIATTFSDGSRPL